jgi:DNA modification methylase
MIDGQMLNKIGVVLQVIAAAYIVLQAGRTAKALANFKVTIDSLEHIIERLGREMAGQFKHQLIGFVVLALGAILQMLS